MDQQAGFVVLQLQQLALAPGGDHRFDDVFAGGQRRGLRQVGVGVTRSKSCFR